MKKIRAGFTLIELIVVIVILGILAAFALPRFASLDTQARAAVTDGLTGSLRAGSALAHGLALATKVTNGSVSMEGTSVLIVNSYPATSSIDDVIVSLDGFNVNAATEATRAFWPTGVTDSSTCQVTYVAAASAGASPTFGGTTSDCS